ncbi:Z1 domain protein [mine drainage metagenome]|uniref:Z1 domain protein n=1 Tax=mine drainage metagenome TaxID=410659 RepID=A0A1J5SCI3_9ZZZZ
MSSMQMDHMGIAMSVINGRPLTDELLEEVLGKLVMLDGTLNQEILADIRSRLEATIGVTHTVGEVMHKKDHLPWLSDVKGGVKWHYWDSYRRLLTSSGRADEIVRVLDEDTDKILTECGNPTDESGWQLRGLVMGDVQSGKTASYTGLIAKAADAGYKVIVLLTGIIEDLRRQTQERLDEGFVGRNSQDVLDRNANTIPIGAGIYRNRSANVLTSVNSDFLTNNAVALGGIPLRNIQEPVLFVMKKNISPLKQLDTWLNKQIPAGSDLLTVPFLMIDDEADNASVNTKKDEDPATINRLIREIRRKFSRSSYVAYTATPFANIFINPDNDQDLFPSDFIYSLNTPSNYIGASSIFLEDGEHYSQLKVIDDAEGLLPYKHDKTLQVEDIPGSLKDAIRIFFLSCAMRDLRKESLKHRSMLINVSRFNDVQKKVKEKVQKFGWGLQEEIKQYLLSTSWESHPELTNLYSLWDAEYGDLEFSWNDVRKALYDAIASVTVLTINQKSVDEEKLNYSVYKNTAKGRRVIAIGGLTLSRGLTLEGLCVSYFYRNSKAYDTLLQMGRWFGYRPGYEDVFRIWMDKDAQDWYAHIATAVSELRRDFRRMSANRMQPSQFGIRVKAHPDTLIVTAQNKMKNSDQIEQRISLSAHGTETAYVPKAGNLHEENIKIANRLISSLGPAITEGSEDRWLGGSRYLWTGISKSKIATFLSELNISNMNMDFLADQDRPLVKFIAENKVSELESWDICIPQGKGGAVPDTIVLLNDGTSSPIRCRERQFERGLSKTDYLKLNKQRVGDNTDEMVGMSQQEIELTRNNWEEERAKDPKKGERIPGYMFRDFRSRPLLTIHFIQCVSPKEDPEKMMRPEEIEAPIMVAISLSFPDFDPNASDDEKKVVYRLNKVAMRAIFGNEEELNDDED